MNRALATNIKRPIVAILTLTLVLAGHTFAEGQSVSDETRSGGPAGSALAVRATDKAAPTVHTRDPRYVICPSDTLEVRFPVTPDFNQTVTVQPDGYITLRDAGALHAAGETVPELTDSIKKAYSSILHNPVVSVDPKDFNKPYFIVGGQVGRPGKFDLRGDVTLTEAVAIAGGFTDAAKHSQVLLFRRVSDQWTEAKIINTKKMFSSHNLQEDPVLQPGDMLFVPKNALSKIKPFLPTTTAGAYYNPATTY
jgi:polysaccharide export outer membrane protein